jgi:flagellar biosynthesis protein FlhA
VITLEAPVEQALLSSLTTAGERTRFVIDPSFAESLLRKVAEQGEAMVKRNLLPVLLCAPELRSHLRALIERVAPHMRVLALSEVPGTVGLASFAVIKVDPPRLAL